MIHADISIVKPVRICAKQPFYVALLKSNFVLSGACAAALLFSYRNGLTLLLTLYFILIKEAYISFYGLHVCT